MSFVIDCLLCNVLDNLDVMIYTLIIFLVEFVQVVVLGLKKSKHTAIFLGDEL